MRSYETVTHRHGGSPAELTWSDVIA